MNLLTRNTEPDIDGWGLIQHVQLMCACSRMQHSLGAFGAVVEIGTYMGSTLIPLIECKRAGELVIAIDPFDAAIPEGIDYQEGGRAALEVNLSRRLVDLADADRAEIDIWETFCQDVAAPQLSARLKGQNSRLFHIDGCRAAHPVTHSLSLAEATLAPDGCIFLDDFLNEGWPSVSEGAFGHLLSGSKLVPFALVKCKLGLCFAPFREAFLETARKAVAEMDLAQKKDVLLFGHSICMGR